MADGAEVVIEGRTYKIFRDLDQRDDVITGYKLVDGKKSFCMGIRISNRFGSEWVVYDGDEVPYNAVQNIGRFIEANDL